MEPTNNNTALAEIHENSDFMMGLNELKARAHMVTEIKRQIMHEGTHWGKVTGCGDKPTLLKNGAELLCMAFKLAPDAKVEIADLGNGHREYTVTTTLTSITTGVPIATGLGSCSTMESKYRYRNSEPVSTGKTVPREYWDERDPALLGGKGYMAKKDESGAWKIFKKGDKKVENPDIADTYNTVLKMASKRSLVDATLKATGGSCEFTQDLEDFKDSAQGGAEYADYSVDDAQPAPAKETPQGRNAQPARQAQQVRPSKTQDEKDANWKSMCDELRAKAPEAFDAFLANHGVKSVMDVKTSAERSKLLADLQETIRAATEAAQGGDTDNEGEGL